MVAQSLLLIGGDRRQVTVLECELRLSLEANERFHFPSSAVQIPMPWDPPDTRPVCAQHDQTSHVGRKGSRASGSFPGDL